MANMFGALNRFISRLDSEQQSKPSGQGSWGFQVLSNTNLELSIEPWFDFVIGINGRPIDNPEPNLFTQEVRNCAGTSISLGVYSAKGQAIREQYVQVPPDASALGLSLQYAPLALSEDIYHILDVTANSPADLAGLLPYSDYVVGSPERVIKGENGFPELVESFIGQPLSLYVYNHEYDVVRIVEITPARGWGGEGALGCVLGFGALHRIPAPLTEPTQDPGETLFNAAETPRFSNEEPRSSPALLHGSFQPPSDGAQVGAPELLTPANLSAPPPPTKAAGSKAAKKAKPAGAADLDDLFKEGEEKSKQLEGRGSTPKNASALPPPPKSGPPKAKSPAPVEVEKAQAELD